MQAALARRLDQPVRLRLDQVLLDPAAGSIDVQREELRQAEGAQAAADRTAATVTQLVTLASGAEPDAIVLDREHQRVIATARPLAGMIPAAYRAMEARIDRLVPGWHVAIVPPLTDLPAIGFADGVDTLDAAAREAVALTIWEAQRWNVAALAVPGYAEPASARPALAERRGAAIAASLRASGIAPRPAPAAGQSFALTPVQP